MIYMYLFLSVTRPRVSYSALSIHSGGDKGGLGELSFPVSLTRRHVSSRALSTHSGGDEGGLADINLPCS